MSKQMERTAEILDTGPSRECCWQTGQGATFVGRKACEKALADLKRLDRGEAARFIVDWQDEGSVILATFGLDDDGFRALTGEEPKSSAEYEAYDAAYWREARAVSRRTT